MDAAGNALRVEFVDSAARIDGGLWDACFPAPLEGRFWYETLEASGLSGQFEFHYALVKSGDRTLGIAPCFVHNVPVALVAPRAVAWVLDRLSRWFPRIGYQRTLFVGSPCSDEGTIGLVDGVALGDVAGVLGSALVAKASELGAPMIVFKDFPEGAMAGLTSLSGRGGFFPMVSFPGTLLRLQGRDMDAYLRSLSGMQRHNLRKKWKRSKALLSLDSRVVRAPCDSELEEIYGLFVQTYLKGRTKFERLDLKFFEAVRKHPEAHFIVQRDAKTGALVAFMLVFHLGRRVVNKFIGIDYGRAGQTYLYFRLFAAALDFAHGVSAAEIQSGQTGYRAKLDLGHRLVPLHNLVRHSNPLVHALYRAVGSRVTWSGLDDDLKIFLRAHPEEVSRAAPR